MIQPAWRGVVVDGTVWAWPSLLLDHNEAFETLPSLRNYTARFRQWNAGEAVDFDTGTTLKDQALILAWIKERT